MKRFLVVLAAAALFLGLFAGCAAAKESLKLSANMDEIVLGETLEATYEVTDLPANAIVMFHVTLYSNNREFSRTDFDENYTDPKKTIQYTLTDPTVDEIEVEAIVYRQGADHYDLQRQFVVRVDGSSPVPAFEVKFDVPKQVVAGTVFYYKLTLEGTVPYDLYGVQRLMEVQKDGDTYHYYNLYADPIDQTLTIGQTYSLPCGAPENMKAIEIWVDLDTGTGWGQTHMSGMIEVLPAGTVIEPDEPEEPDEQAVAKVRSFVGRCYNLILDREAEEGGMTYWAGLLTGKKSTASAIIDEFTKGDEFKGRPLTSADKVDILYKTMLDRGADEAGKAYWVGQLDAGVSEAAIINGFCGSEEFATICADYGIEAGSVDVPQPVDPDQPAGEGIEGFVQRCYTKALDRAFDQGGVDYWVSEMRKGTSPQEVAKKFIFSEEADAKGRSNDEFIRTMYRLYMGREADDGGLAYWNEQMANGMNREQVNDGFAGSEEFTNIVAGFGL